MKQNFRPKKIVVVVVVRVVFNLIVVVIIFQILLTTKKILVQKGILSEKNFGPKKDVDTIRFWVN